MEEKKPSPTFKIRILADKPAFPTDYSTHILSKKWKYHHDTIGKYISSNPLFATFYDWMRYATKDSVSNTPYVQRGIPAELEPFFHEYLSFLLPNDSTHAINSNLTPEEVERLFALSLFPKAVEAEKEYQQKYTAPSAPLPLNPDNNADLQSGLFWYRRLYENPYFQSAVSEDYWKKEYSWRCKLIEELSLKLPQAQQIQELKKMISYMDVRIAFLLCCVDLPKGDHNQEPPNIAFDDSGFTFAPSFLSTSPPQLINSLRTVNRTVESELSLTKRTEYIVPNVPLQIDHPKINTLGDAINLLTKPKNAPGLREIIQANYLKLVCTVPEKSEFQKVSEDLQSYLNLYSTTDHDFEKYKRFIESCCFNTYRNIMWYNIPMRGDEMGPPINDAALQQFVETAVSNFFNLFYYPIADIVAAIQSAFNRGIVDCCVAQCEHIDQLINQGTETHENLYKLGADTFKANLIRLWPRKNFVSSAFLDSEFSEETIDRVSSIMAQYCHDVNHGYEVMIDWASKDLFCRAWKRYYQTQSLAKDAPPAYGHALDYLLTAGLLITKTWDSMNFSHKTTLWMFKELTTYINTKNSRPPEATCQDSSVTSEGLKRPGDDHSGTGTGQP